MKHRVKVKYPHIQSYAALVQLKRKLQTQRLNSWLKFRDDFLNHMLTVHKDLICIYCNRSNLLKAVPDESKQSIKILATIDHIIPVSKGGDEFDYNNLAIACRPCNERKSNK